jgi:4-hydroxy-3-methylbut-2-en-1-yl diphosphate reductase
MRDVIVEIDEGSGCCFGVVNATKKAEKVLEEEGLLFSLGDIVHNGEEVNRLFNKGLQSIDKDQFELLSHTKVLIRAHGEPPSTYAKAKERGIELLDATCPVVLKLQNRIAEAYTTQKDCQVVIYGKKGHAEVVGLVGQTNGDAIVIENSEQIEKLDFSKNIILFSQTTQSIDGFNEIVAAIKQQLQAGVTFEYKDTICRQVANRIPRIKEFAKKHDVVLFLSDKKSSNGKVLYEECKKVNPSTCFLSKPEDFDATLIEGAVSVGISGATSTPKWQMEKLKQLILLS